MGVRFICNSNNGVTALMGVEWHKRIYDEEQFQKGQQEVDWTKAIGEGLRIFTFCNARRLMRNPREMRYFTGIHEDMTTLLEHPGKENSGLFPKSFYVPFSNGWGLMRNEHEFAVSHDDLVQWFGMGAETSVL